MIVLVGEAEELDKEEMDALDGVTTCEIVHRAEVLESPDARRERIKASTA